MHPQSPPLTIGGTVLKESDHLVILGVIFYSKMTFEKHLRLVSRAASQRLDILWKSWRVFHDRSLLGRCFHRFVLPILERCRTLQYSRTFIPFSVSLWNDLANPVFDGVGLAGFKSRANASLLA